MMVAQAFSKDERAGRHSGIPACLILLACLLCGGTAGAEVQPPKLRVVVRPPIRHTAPAKPQAAAAGQAAKPVPQTAPESVAVYRRLDADGTVALTNRPDGDPNYRYFGHFSAERLMRAVGPEGVARLAGVHAAKYGVDSELVMAIIRVESGFDARAVSPAGASGLMQLMPGTQRELGVQDAFDPDANVEGGVRYFRSMLDRYGGNVSLALAAYNAGPANVDRYGGIPPFEETQKYVRKVLALYASRQ